MNSHSPAQTATAKQVVITERSEEPRDDPWDSLSHVTIDPKHLLSNRVITFARSGTAAGAIDLLRTRILNAMEERRWRHVGITSPTTGCGKTLIASNLGFSLAREKHLRTLLFDMNLRNPSLAEVLGISRTGSLVPALEDIEPLETRLLRVTENFAVGLQDAPCDTAAELLKSSVTDQVLSRTFDALEPDVVLYDLPAGLLFDDVLAFKNRLDAVIMVVRGGQSTPKEVRDLEALLEGDIPILATVLNEVVDG